MANTIETAVQLATIELCLQPEYGAQWVGEILNSAGLEASEQNRELFETELTNAMKELTALLIAQLPPELAAIYK